MPGMVPGARKGLVSPSRRTGRAPRDALFQAATPATPCALLEESQRPMRAVLDVVLLALQLYIYLLIASAVLSWLIAFNVVNTRNQVVAAVGEFLYRITEPALRPIRSLMPNLGGIDISPVILILLIILIENVIVYYIRPNVF
jgi:YggT family protein